MRPAHAFALGHFFQLVKSDFVAEILQFVNNFRVARIAVVANFLKQGFQFLTAGIDEKSDDMELPAPSRPRKFPRRESA